MKSYDFQDIVKLAEASKSQLTHWTRARVIHAGVRETSGTGDHRRFSSANLAEALIARELHGLGVGTATIGDVIVTLKQIDDIQEPRPDVVEDWRRFRNPATRPAGGTALLAVTLTPDLPQRVHALLFVGDASTFTLPPLAPGHCVSLLVDLANICRVLESKTEGDWWEPVGFFQEQAHIQDAMQARDQSATADAEAARIDRLATTQPAVALDRKLRADLGLPARTYAARWWESPLLTEADAAEYRRGNRKLTKKVSAGHPAGLSLAAAAVKVMKKMALQDSSIVTHRRPPCLSRNQSQTP